MDRLAHERAFHDSQAAARASDLGADLSRFQFLDTAWLDHESWIRPAVEQLAVRPGMRVLDYGCGHGMAAVVFARQGAEVVAFDLSGGYVAEAGRRAHANGVTVAGVQADGERLPFADQTFDRIWGNAVLHHLDLASAARELRRVLKPDGIAVFCEPWAGNPLLQFARRHLPYRGKHRTVDEAPLPPRAIGILKTIFPDLHWRGFQLLTMAGRFLPAARGWQPLARFDERMLTSFPFLQNYCRYVVLVLPRGPL